MELGNSELNIYIIKSPTLIVFHRHEAFIWKIVILIMKLRAHACWILFHPSPPQESEDQFPNLHSFTLCHQYGAPFSFHLSRIFSTRGFCSFVNRLESLWISPFLDRESSILPSVYYPTNIYWPSSTC